MVKFVPPGTLAIWNPRVPEITNWPVAIVGIAHIEVSVLGISYIVELRKPIDDYPYTYAVAFERDLEIA